MIREYSCQFGKLNRLNGILTIPAGDSIPDIGFILVTAGLTPKPGPFRLYTMIAREAAKKGFACFRFDLGGIGNSEQIHTGYPLNVRTELDLNETIEFLSKTYGIESFVMGGLCSGAEDSFRYALKEPRVVGVILLDGHAYVTEGWQRRHRLSRRFLNKKIRRLLTQLGVLEYVHSSGKSVSLEDDQSGLVDYKQMELEESSRTLRELLERNTKLQYIYTGGMYQQFNSKEQFIEMYKSIDLKGLVSVHYLPHMEHVQMFEEDRKELCDIISDWLNENFSSKSEIAQRSE